MKLFDIFYYFAISIFIILLCFTLFGVDNDYKNWSASDCYKYNINAPECREKIFNELRKEQNSKLIEF